MKMWRYTIPDAAEQFNRETLPAGFRSFVVNGLCCVVLGVLIAFWVVCAAWSGWHSHLQFGPTEQHEAEPCPPAADEAWRRAVYTRALRDLGVEL